MIRTDLLNQLMESYAAFTRSEKKVADYIFSNKTQTIYMSITNLAEACGVGDATIFRFCKTLGFEGYNDFKLSLAKSVTPDSVDPEYALYGEVLPKDSISDMCKKLYGANSSALSQTLALINESDIKRAVPMLSNANRVYCMGQGSSLVTAMEAYSLFLSVSANFICIQDSHQQAMAASLLTPDDTVLFFSYSGATKDMLDVLRPAKENGAKVILITRFTKSPATKFAHVVLLCGSNEGPLQLGSISAKIAQLFLVDILFNEYCRQNLTNSIKNREATADAIAVKLL